MTRRHQAALAGTAVVTAVAGILRYATSAGVVPFAAAAVALAGLAYLVAFGTEQVGARYGPAVTGFMQSTLGNLPEFFIVIFALSAGETVVAQTSIIGSLFANALLVLGLVIVVGARSADDGLMSFKVRLPMDTATLLLVAVFIIVITGLSAGSSDKASAHIETIDAIGAGCVLFVYAAWIRSYLRSDTGPAADVPHGSTLPLPIGLGVLAAAGTGSAFVSDWFIHALDPAIRTLGISKAFAGLVIVAIAGNAVENFTGLVLARKRNFDLGGEELRRPDRGLPVPGARARLAGVRAHAHVPAGAGVHRRDAAHRDRRVADNRRRRGDGVRGLGARVPLRDPGDVRAV